MTQPTASHSSTLSVEEIRSIETLYRAFTDKNPDLLDEACTPDWQDIPLLPGQGPGPDGLKKLIPMFLKAFPDLNKYGKIDSVVLEEIPVPKVGLNEVLVQVEAASINPLDVKLISGNLHGYFPLNMPYSVGTDLSGTVPVRSALGADSVLYPTA